VIDMLEKVKKTILEHKLITQGDKVLVALSGGADSVCLLVCLLALADALNLSVSAAHVNHGLRGQDADRDEEFVRSLCDERGVPLYVHRADVSQVAKERKVGLEEAGRYVRYSFFDDLMKEHGFDKIATAHHAGDAIETVLMRLMRGTGILGLAGIPYQNGAVIRPLLDTTRQEIEAFLEKQNLSYRTDLSNYETNFTRNRVRHELIPLIEEKFNPGFARSFQEQIGLYADCSAYIQEEAEKLFVRTATFVPGGYGFACQKLLNENEFVVSTMLHLKATKVTGGEVSGQHIRRVMDILKAQSGAVTLPKEGLAEVCHGVLYIRNDISVKAFAYTFETKVFIPEADCYITVKEKAEKPQKRGRNVACLDAEKLKGKKLMVRNRAAGDAFYPTGMEGKKKLQDFFVDQKVPYFMRDRIPILTADDEIVWIAGYRPDRRFAATDETSAVICVEIHKGEQL